MFQHCSSKFNYWRHVTCSIKGVLYYVVYVACKIFNALKYTWKLVEQGQLSFLLKHQGSENYFAESVPHLDQFSLGDCPESFDLSEELDMHTDRGPQHGGKNSVVFYSFNCLFLASRSSVILSHESMTVPLSENDFVQCREESEIGWDGSEEIRGWNWKDEIFGTNNYDISYVPCELWAEVDI